MKKALVILCAVWCAVAQARSLGVLDYAMVPDADVVLLYDYQTIQRTEFMRQAMIKEEVWTQKIGGTEIDSGFRQQFLELGRKYGVDWERDATNVGLIVASFSGDSTAKGASQLDMLVGLEVKDPKVLPPEALREGLALVWKQFDLKKLAQMDYRLSFKNGSNFSSVTLDLVFADPKKKQDLPLGWDTWTTIQLDSRLVLVGPSAVVWSAYKRYQEKKPAVLDPYLAENLEGHICLALRMQPAVRQSLEQIQDQSMAALKALSKGQGMKITCQVTDKLDLELNFQCGEEGDAIAFKKEIWNSQLAMVAGMIGGMLKAQSNQEITCFDYLKCIADGRQIRILLPITIRDIDGFVNYVAMQLEAQKKAPAKAAQVKPAKAKPAKVKPAPVAP